MKIALCFAGQPRFIDRMNFDNLIQDHEVLLMLTSGGMKVIVEIYLLGIVI